MNILIILVPVSFALSALALVTFLWTLRNAQYDDLEGDPCRILFEDDTIPPRDDTTSTDDPDQGPTS